MTALGQPVVVPTAEAMRALGTRLANWLRAGDLVLLSGALGAGKTTLTQGIGEGLGVRGPITSPTFVIARVHPSLVGGPPLVHVDAYRLAGWDELEDLDLEATLDDAVTIVEWGDGLAEGLSQDRLEVRIHRPTTTPTPGTPAAPIPVAAPIPAAPIPAAPIPVDHATVGRHADDDSDVRKVEIITVGQRWADVPLLAEA
jgi:tRNA threonylcarbamoyladenosine biosynthesis protein TsaE